MRAAKTAYLPITAVLLTGLLCALGPAVAHAQEDSQPPAVQATHDLAAASASAATHGAVLVYDLSGLPDPEALMARLKAVQTKLVRTLTPGTELRLVQNTETRRKTVRTDPDGPPQVETEQINRAAFMLGVEDEALVARIAAAVAEALPELPAAERSDTTWLGESVIERGITINLSVGDRPRQFVFPFDTPDSEIAAVITAWLTEQEPHLRHDVQVTSTGDSKQRQVQLRIESATLSAD